MNQWPYYKFPKMMMVPSDVTNTLLQEPDMTENWNVVSFAPGEGNRPLGIFMDKEPGVYHFLQFAVDKPELTTSKVQHLYLGWGKTIL